jgi:putative transposase
MYLEQGNIYHVFNRGNNKQKIFFDVENYPYFLKKLNQYLTPYCDILAWCLMPNHFHLLIYANHSSIQLIEDGSFKRQRFSQAIKQLLSSYTKAINKRYERTGSLFQQKTKAVCVSDGETGYATTAFHYIHQNPMRSNLVARMEDWEFSSFRDYAGMRSGTFCRPDLAMQYLDIAQERFYEDSYKVINVSYTYKV